MDSSGHGQSIKRTARAPLVVEVVLRIVLTVAALVLENVKPFHRVIRHQELLTYRHPHTPDSLPFGLLVVVSLSVPIAFISIHFFASGDKTDLIRGTLGLTLAASLTWLVINILKVSVGRPRPDFYYRCFPTELLEVDETALHCTGNTVDVEQGLKSFPSGHTGWIFSCYGFLSLYLCEKLHCFKAPGRNQGWRLCAVLGPIVMAVIVGVSRIQSHKHHWEDVLVGGLLGFTCAVLCYYQHYPCPVVTSGVSPFSSHQRPITPPYASSSLITSNSWSRSKSATLLTAKDYSGSGQDGNQTLHLP